MFGFQSSGENYCLMQNVGTTTTATLLWGSIMDLSRGTSLFYLQVLQVSTGAIGNVLVHIHVERCHVLQRYLVFIRDLALISIIA